MQLVTLSTDGLPATVRADSWREFISKMIRNVSVEDASPRDFAARISARRQGETSCASFWSRSHEVHGRRESFASAGASGYLVSWQLEGEAHITQEENRLLVKPGEIAIIDGRRAMSARFPGDVRRIVANLPARAVERALPSLLQWHTLVMRPAGPFAEVLNTYLTELASGQQRLGCDDVDLVVENICNLLSVTSRQDAISFSPRELHRQAVVSYVRRHACTSDISLERVAADLNLSRRLVQKLLQELNTSFTELILSERLEAASRQLRTSKSAISTVAYLCGFNDVSHFNHAFKSRFGKTPSEMRNLANVE